MRQYLNRAKVYEKVEPIKNAKKVYIFCEGQAKEVNYFTYFKGFSSNIDIIPIPNTDGKSDPIKLKENAELLFLGSVSESGHSIHPRHKLSEEYGDEIWFAIDTDRWNEGNKIQSLKDFCGKMGDRWLIAQSNPSFELWLYFHFFENKPEASHVERHTSFKEYVNDQIKGGFDHRSMPIEIEKAIENSKLNFKVDNNQPDLYSTELHHLGEVILLFIKEQLDKAKSLLFQEAKL